MTLASLTLPSDGQTIHAADVNVPFNALVGVLNGHVDSTNIAAASLPWSVMANFSNTIPASAMQDSGNLETFASEQTVDAVLIGCVLTITSGLNWSLTSGFVRIGGKRVMVNSTTGTVVSSQDTYFSVNQSGTVTYTGTNAVANNSNPPSLSASSMWLYKAVSGASLTSIVNIQPAEKIVQPANYSAAIVASFVAQDIPNSTITSYIPAGYALELTFGSLYQNGSTGEHDLVLWDNQANASLISATNTAGGVSSYLPYYYTPASPGIYSFRLRGSAGGSGTFDFRGLFIKTRIVKLVS